MKDLVIWSPGISLEQIEKQVILKALSFYHKDKVAVSNSLKISISALENKLAQYEKDAAQEAQVLSEVRSREADFQLRSRGMPVPQSNAPLSAQSPVKESPSKRARTS